MSLSPGHCRDLRAGKVGEHMLPEAGTAFAFSFLLSASLHKFPRDFTLLVGNGRSVGQRWAETRTVGEAMRTHISFYPHSSFLMLVLVSNPSAYALDSYLYSEYNQNQTTSYSSITSRLARWPKPQLSLTWTILIVS